jgi:hypothetical protein
MAPKNETVPLVGRLLHLRADRGITQNGAALFTVTDKAALTGTTTITRGATVDFSLEIWLNPTAFSGYRIVFTDQTSSGGIQLYVDPSGNVIFDIYASDSTQVSVACTTPITAGAWAHVVVTCTRTGNIVIYVNGAVSKTGSMSTLVGKVLSGVCPPVFGRHSFNPTNHYGGAIAGVRYYDGFALTAAEVTRLYNRKEPIPYATLPADIKAKLGTQGADWPLTDEPVVGVAYLDLHGSNDLTFSAAELSTNGGFGSDTSGWTAAGSATLSSEAGGQSGNCLKILNGAAIYGIAKQNITAASGNTYSLTAYHKNGTTTGQILVGSTDGGAGLYVGPLLNDADWSQKSVPLTATSALLSIQLYNYTSGIGDNTLFDTVSLVATKLRATNGPSGAYASDSSGNGYHATLTGFSTDQIQTAWVPRGDGLALTFDGTNGYVATGKTDNDLLTQAAGTFSAWIRATAASPNRGASDTGYIIVGCVDQYVWLSQASVLGADRIWCGSWAGGVKEVGVTFTLNEWVHVTWCHSNGQLIAYKNGVEVDRVACGNPTGWNRAVAIGGLPGGYRFVGNIDDVRFYNVALTPAQIAQLYTLNEDQEVTGATATAHYTFNDGPPTQTATDGEPVAAWESIEGNRHIFRQTNILKRPKWIRNVLNGQPVVRFDGMDDYLFTNTAILTGAAGTVLAYYQLPAATLDALQYFLSQSITSGANQFLGLIARGYNATPRAGLGHVTGAAVTQYEGNTSISTNAAICAIWTSTGTTLALLINGTAQTLTFAAGSDTGQWWHDIVNATQTAIGCLLRSSPAYFSKIDLAELIVYDRVLSASELARCLAYGVGRYGVSP